MIDLALAAAVRLALAVLFAFSAWYKLSDAPRFTATLREYQALPPAIVPMTARSLGVFEAATAVLLAYPPTQRLGAVVAGALLCVYTAAIVLNLGRGRRDIDCGCFGPSARVPLSGALVLRNFVLIGAAAVAAMPVRSRALVWIDALTVIVSVATACVLWAAAQRLARTGPALRRLRGES